MPITEDPNPFFAGYNAHRAAKAEIGLLEQEAEKNSVLMEQYRQKIAAQAAAAPFESRKLQQEYDLKQQELEKGDLEQEQAEVAFIGQRLAPIIKAVDAGTLSQLEAMAHIERLKATLPFEVDEETLYELDSQGLDGYRMLVQQARTLEDQFKLPGRPIAAQVGDQKVYLDPNTRQPIPGLGGPAWAPPRTGGNGSDGRGKAPSGYQWLPDGSQTYIKGGPYDPDNAKRKGVVGGKGDHDQKYAAIQGAIKAIAGLLNQAAEEGDTVTGVVGTVKRYGGGLARQAGMPVSPRAEGLSRALERLQAIAGPALLADSRLSNDERKRVESIVGNIDPMTDDVALRQSLAELATIIDSLGGGAPPDQPESGKADTDDDALINKYLQ